MSAIKRVTVSALLRMYPARWRHEYGEELTGILMDKILGPSALFDVFRAATGQQLRVGEPWLILGVPLLIFNLAIMVWNTFNPATYVGSTLDASPAQRILFWLPALCVGCWTVLRNPEHGQPGMAAMKSALLTTWPVSLIALLAAIGVLSVVTLGPGDLPGRLSAHGLTITLYDRLGRPTHLFPLFVLPIFNLPAAAVGGCIGGLSARVWLRLGRRKTAE